MHFIADSLNHIWKFLIFSIDRVVELNERTIEKKFETDLVDLSQKLRESKKIQLLDKLKWNAKEAEYKEIIADVRQDKIRYEEEFKKVKIDFERFQDQLEIEKRKYKKGTLYQEFFNMEKNIK